MHFIELCDALVYPHPAADDHSGESYTFEKGVTTTTGGQGFADVWKRSHFAWEYKSKDKDLKAAYQQLLKYREDLENPPLLVVCDLIRFEIHTNFTDTAKKVYRFTLDDLLPNTPTSDCTLPPLDVLRAFLPIPIDSGPIVQRPKSQSLLPRNSRLSRTRCGVEATTQSAPHIF